MNWTDPYSSLTPSRSQRPFHFLSTKRNFFPSFARMILGDIPRGQRGIARAARPARIARRRRRPRTLMNGGGEQQSPWISATLRREFGRPCFESASGPNNRPHGQALDQNRKTPISKPAANAQRPNVQAETTRTRLRRSWGISWDRSVIATAPPFAAIAGAALYGRAASRRPSHAFRLNPNSGAVCPASNIGVALFAGLFCIWQPAAHAGRFS
jgi:hypothetical protein